MQVKNDNNVALERRLDLASLFCMIGRHGPAVVLAVIGIVSVVVGFIIYRTVKGKWRKATVGSDSKSPAACRETPSLEPEPSPEEFLRSAVDSTDVRDEGLSDAVLTQSDIRHRRPAAAEKNPPHYYYYPPEVPDSRHYTSALQDNFKVSAEDLTNRSSQRDNLTEVEDEEHGHVSCVMPEQNYREEEQVLECENVSTEKKVSEQREEENFPDSTVCFEQHKADDKLQEDEVTTDTNSNIEEPVIHYEDVSCVCENNYVDHMSSEAETKSVCEEAAEECVDHQVSAQQVETVDPSFEEGTKLSPQHKQQCDGVIDQQYNDGLTSDVSIENLCEDHVSILSECDAHSLQQDLHIEQKENVITEEILTSCEEAEVKQEHKEPAEQCVDHQPTGQQVETTEPSYNEGTIMSMAQKEELCDGLIEKQHKDGLTSGVSIEHLCEDHVSSLAESEISSQRDPQIEQKEDDVLKEEILTSCEEEERKDVCEELTKECVDHQLTGQQVETIDPSFEEGTVLLTTRQEERCDGVIDDQCNYGLTSDVFIENVCEDRVSLLSECDAHSLQQDLQIEQKENVITEGILTSSEEAEVKHEHKEPAEQCVDHQPTGQQVEVIPSFEEGTIMSMAQQEEQCDVVIDEQCKDGLTSHVSIGNVCEDDVNNLAECDEHSLKQDLQTEQEQDGVLEQEILTPCEEEETKDECKDAAEECVDHQPTGQQVDSGTLNKTVDPSFEDGIVLSSQHKEQCDGVIDEQYSDSLTNVVYEGLQTEQEDDVVKEEILTSCTEDDISSVVITPLKAVEPESVGDSLCITAIDEKARMSDVDVPEMSDYQQPQVLVKAKEEELCDLSVCSDLTSLKEEIESEKSETCTVLSSFYKDQTSQLMEHEEVFHNTKENSVTDGAVCVEDEGKQCDQIPKTEDFPEVTDSLENIKTPISLIQLSSFEQSELLSFGEESGISSMTISPDLQDDGFVMTPENVLIPVVDFPPESEEQTKLQVSADDVPLFVCKGQTDPAVDESLAANEDMFGHEVEDSYHRDVERFMVQIEASVTSLTTDTTKKTDRKDGAEKAEEEQECEKTEISIMEATMDNNEWITDGNYQVLPWMNLSIPCLVQNHTKTGPTEEHQHCPSPADVPCIDTDITHSVEARPADSFPLLEENTESNKKVVAVQPMPQNVNVTFRIHYLTHSPYQTVAITGSHQELGNWKGFIPLERAKDGHWATVVSLPAESHVEWKFVVLDKGEVCRWEECGNRLLDTGYGDDLLVHKWWGLL